MAAAMTMKVLYELPPESTSPNDGVAFWRHVRFEYIRDRAWYRRAIEFKGVVAQRRWGERCMTEWHDEADDRLVEIENSDWLREICADADDDGWRRECSEKHHYMIGLRDAATLEVIADSWKLLPEEKAEWPEIPLR